MKMTKRKTRCKVPEDEPEGCVRDVDSPEETCLENGVSCETLKILNTFCDSKGLRLKILQSLPGYYILTDIAKGNIYIDISCCNNSHVYNFIESFK